LITAGLTSGSTFLDAFSRSIQLKRGASALESAASGPHVALVLWFAARLAACLQAA
jgi:hypothetical protein